jgi:hypothetical protein
MPGYFLTSTEPLTTVFVPEMEATASAFKASEREGSRPVLLESSKGAVFFEGGEQSPSKTELNDQFLVFQFGKKKSDPAIIESSRVVPELQGSEERPDVNARLELLSFHVGHGEKVEPDTRATMRIDFGNSPTAQATEVFTWAVAAGIDLYEKSKKKENQESGIKGDLNKSFGNRPIEIARGLGKMTFQVIKHKERPWWRSVFDFVGGGAGKSIISMLGFPALTNDAIRVINQLLDKFDDAAPEVLFKSRPLRFALTQHAKDEVTGGSERVPMGALNKGYCLLARGGDFATIVDNDAYYYPTYEKLLPASVTPEQAFRRAYEDPFAEITYAVFRLGLAEAQLAPRVSFGG